MQILVNRSALVKDLNLVAGVTERRATIPILNHILLEGDGDESAAKVTLKGTDLDVSLTATCDAAITGSGAICLNAKKLFEVVRSLPDGEITINVNQDQQAEILSGKARFKLLGLPKVDFPEVKATDEWLVSIPAATLATFISHTAFAMTIDESRYALNGVQLELTSTAARMIATDGHRLSFISAAADYGAQGLGEAVVSLIPKKAVAELARLCNESPERKVDFAQDADHLYFKIGRRSLSSRRLTGNFPNYDLVLPKDNRHKAVVEAEALAQAIRRVALMADAQSSCVKLEVSQNHLKISAQSSDVGESVEELAVAYDGPDITIGFNAKYVLDFFLAISGGQVSVEFKDDKTQAQMRSASESVYDFRYVIMPMRF